MPFLLAEILNFQGSTHHIGVGSFSNIIINICKNNGIYNELAIKAKHVKELYNINQITK